MKDLIKFEQGSNITTTTTEKGITKVAFKSAKDFKAEYRVKFPDSTSTERKLAFEAYVREQSQEIAKALDMAKMISLIEQGKLGVKRLAINKKGTEMTTVFIDVSRNAKPQEIRAQVAEMNEADLKDLLAYLQEKLASQVKEAKNDFTSLLTK